MRPIVQLTNDLDHKLGVTHEALYRVIATLQSENFLKKIIQLVLSKK